MRRLGRAFSLAIIATFAGLILQCASDPSITGDGGVIDTWLSDLGIIDGAKADATRDSRVPDRGGGLRADATRDSVSRARDSIGPKADAAPTPTDWFTMTYRRDGGSADSLLATSSDVTVEVGHLFVSGNLAPVVASMSLRVFDQTVQSLLSLNAIFKGVAAPSTVDFSQMTQISFGETGASDTTVGSWTFLCTRNATSTTCQVSGSVTFTQVGLALIAGSYDLTFDDGGGKTRALSGQFEAVPTSQPGELRP